MCSPIYGEQGQEDVPARGVVIGLGAGTVGGIEKIARFGQGG
jgi:hypothetical protein